MIPPRPIRVFISYSHDSEEHREAVAQLAASLRTRGIDAWIDRYVLPPEEGWVRWMKRQIEDSDFVLLVCTEVYRQRFDGRASGEGRGVTYEGLLASQLIHDGGSKNRKFIAVLLNPGDTAHIPLELRPYSYYLLPEGFDSLLCHLHGLPELTPPPLGRAPLLPEGSSPPLATEAIRSAGARSEELLPRSPTLGLKVMGAMGLFVLMLVAGVVVARRQPDKPGLPPEACAAGNVFCLVGVLRDGGSRGGHARSELWDPRTFNRAANEISPLRVVERTLQQNEGELSIKLTIENTSQEERRLEVIGITGETSAPAASNCSCQEGTRQMNEEWYSYHISPSVPFSGSGTLELLLDQYLQMSPGETVPGNAVVIFRTGDGCCRPARLFADWRIPTGSVVISGRQSLVVQLRVSEKWFLRFLGSQPDSTRIPQLVFFAVDDGARIGPDSNSEFDRIFNHEPTVVKPVPVP